MVCVVCGLYILSYVCSGARRYGLAPLIGPNSIGFYLRKETGSRGFESHSRHGCVCARLFHVCVFCVQKADLRRADPSSKESYRICIGLRN
jgi:hypothetical protein